MESHLAPGDPILVENIVSYLKAMGVFDEFRHECLADVDTKSSCQNLSQRVDGYTAKFLANETWNPDMNKNEVRNKLRKHIDESGMLAVGADHVVEQVINPKIHQLFLPKIIEVVHQYLNKETEKLNKKQESVNSEKLSKETSNENTTKAKSAVLDPIADILSFTYSKPKQVPSTAVQNSQSKVSDVVKVEKKKEEVVNYSKPLEPAPKPEKKEDVFAQVKTSEVLSRIKKEDVSDHTTVCDILPNSEKKEEVIKTEAIELSKENLPVSEPQKRVEDSKDLGKLGEEFVDANSENVKKLEKEDVKQEKKKLENLKLQLTDKLPQPEESVDIKSSPSAIKSNSSKIKFESPKHKKIKISGSPKLLTKTSECHKSSIKESSDSSSDKLSGEQNKLSSKSSKLHIKDQSSSLKNNISTKMVKLEKGVDSGSKEKSKIMFSKSSEKCTSSKVDPSKKEDSSAKLKHSDNHEKSKIPKTLSSKSGKKQSESSSGSEKGSKTNYQNTSYESSQGSDPDKSSSSSASSKEKVKHFSKHHHKGSSNVDSGKTTSSDKKQSHSDSDSGTPKKDKSKKVSKFTPEELKKSVVVQESAKISSRSDSFGSTSSTSDSQTSLKESSISTSGDTSDSSSKPSDKKKQVSKDKDSCAGAYNLPPPSPPPPSSGLPMPGTTSPSELSSTGDIQSSPDSAESDDSESSEEDVSSQSDDNNSSDSNQEADWKAAEFFHDINDVFLFSSSSSEFEGFSSPEKTLKLKNFSSDVSVSSVNTSDLSSFEDELSEPECSKDLSGKGKSSKRFTIKEAQEILKAKAKQQQLDSVKVEALKRVDVKQNNLQNSTAVTTLVENEVPPTPEPKRESRRERKLNPKYASSEYASIFNSKRTSFITKQANQNESKQASSPDTKKTLVDDVPNNKRKTSTTTPDKNDAQSKVPSDCLGSVRNIISESSTSNESGSVKVEYISEDISSDLYSKTNAVAADKNHNTLAETDTRNRIALKIKISASKNDNKTNKDPNTHGTKRKFEGSVDKNSAKRTCHRNSLSASSLESVPNENKPLNNKSKHSASVDRPNDKEIFHKQKVNNGAVLNKAEHVRRNSISKANHINEQPGD